MTIYDMVFFNHDDLEKIPGDFKIKDLYELLEFFKKKKTNIFINFYCHFVIELTPLSSLLKIVSCLVARSTAAFAQCTLCIKLTKIFENICT